MPDIIHPDVIDSDTPDPDFEGLMNDVLNGSDDAARVIVDRYGKHIRRVVRRKLSGGLRAKFDTMDIEQIVWMTFFDNIGRVSKLQHSVSLVRYLSSIAYNKVIDGGVKPLRTGKRNVLRERPIGHEDADEDLVLARGEPTPSYVAMTNEALSTALNGLSDRHAAAVELRLSGMTNNEIAGRLAVDVRTVRRLFEEVFRRCMALTKPDNDPTNGGPQETQQQ